jgi:hypothetical protein
VSRNKNALQCARAVRVALPEFGSEQVRRELGNVEPHCYTNLKNESFKTLKTGGGDIFLSNAPKFPKERCFLKVSRLRTFDLLIRVRRWWNDTDGGN